MAKNIGPVGIAYVATAVTALAVLIGVDLQSAAASQKDDKAFYGQAQRPATPRFIKTDAALRR